MGHGRSATQLAPATADTTRDYTMFSAYIDTQGLLLYEGEGAKNTVSTIEIEVPQTDTRTNANELPDALGRHYSGNDFSHGAGQEFLHKGSSDPAKYNHSEGFDISKSGLLKNLPAVLTAAGSAFTAGSSGRDAQTGGKTFYCDGNGIRVYDDITGAATTEDPHAGEAAGVVYDLIAEGDRVFAALGANGIHVRDAAGTWTHYNAAAAILISFLKDRIIAATARLFYEITASGAAPSPKTTLKEGWTFTDLGETGTYIYASAIKENAGLSKVFHYGLDASLVLIEKGSTWLPNTDLCYCVLGHFDQVYLGCGRQNKSGGKDAIFYKAEVNDDGTLASKLVMDSTGAGARDLAVRALTTQGRNVLLGWTLGASAPFGVREGIAKYDPALDAFSHHLASSLVTVTPDPVLSCSVFEGRIVFATIDGVYYEDTTKFVAQAYIIPSTGNFGRPNLKNWDESSLSTKALPATTSVDIQYSQSTPDAGDWSLAGQHSITGGTEATFDHPNLDSADFSVKIISNATSSQVLAPEIKTFSVRSNPTVADTPYLVIATVRLFDRDSLGERGQEIRQNPTDIKEVIESYYLNWFDWYSADVPLGYHVRLKNFSVAKPALPIFSTVTGEELKEGYLVTLEMRGTRNS